MEKSLVRLMCILGVLGTAAGPMYAHAADASPRTVVIEAKRFSYSPGEITLKKGEPVVLVLKSRDVAHGLRFRELNVNLSAKAGGTVQTQFTPNQAGDFVGHCSVFCGSGHGSMALKLHVVN